MSAQPESETSLDLLPWGAHVNQLDLVELSHEEFDCMPEAYQGEELDGMSPGISVTITPYPGVSSADATRRLRAHAGMPLSASYRDDGCFVIAHGVEQNSTGRLGSWTGLSVGEVICWSIGDDRRDAVQAIRIAKYLERIGKGRFVVFSWEHLFVRRIG